MKVDPTTAAAILIEEAESRGLSVADALATMKRNELTEREWLHTPCPCCKTYPQHQALYAAIIAALEAKGRQ
jgi:hypothetical protein